MDQLENLITGWRVCEWDLLYSIFVLPTAQNHHDQCHLDPAGGLMFRCLYTPYCIVVSVRRGTPWRKDSVLVEFLFRNWRACFGRLFARARQRVVFFSARPLPNLVAAKRQKTQRDSTCEQTGSARRTEDLTVRKMQNIEDCPHSGRQDWRLAVKNVA